jgi:hypothetical protein
VKLSRRVGRLAVCLLATLVLAACHSGSGGRPVVGGGPQAAPTLAPGIKGCFVGQQVGEIPAGRDHPACVDTVGAPPTSWVSHPCNLDGTPHGVYFVVTVQGRPTLYGRAVGGRIPSLWTPGAASEPPGWINSHFGC